jgi:hypothetical protein
MKAQFRAKLSTLIYHGKFDREKALDLSQSIHDAESNGYQCTDVEEVLWEKLTDKIELTTNV